MLDDDTETNGIADFAQNELEDVVFVVVQEVGDHVNGHALRVP